MYFSEANGVASGDWFDRLLEVDTQLFVDPFLIYAETAGSWSHAGDKIAEYFQSAFEILAGHQGSPDSLQYRKVVTLMLFPEPSEFGLGFVSRGTRGSGTAVGFARRIVRAMATAIEAGLQDLHHFEELGVLVDRIGRDRISDITLNILKPEFIEYTQRVCTELGIPMEEREIEHSLFDDRRQRWVTSKQRVPVNPVDDEPILLTPKRFLRELPTLGVGDWWNYAEPYFREDLNFDLATKMRKEDIVALAKRHPEKVREWSNAREAQPANPYDVDRDPEGLHGWQAQGKAVQESSPIAMGDQVEPAELDAFIQAVNGAFKHFVEEQGGWRLLYNDETGTPKREASIQLLYKGVVQAYCDTHGVALDREVELGRGPVDFVFTRSARDRVLLEVKKMNNGEYWHGLEEQLTSYLNSAGCSRGWFLAVRLGDTKTQRARTDDLARRTRSAAKATGFSLRSDWVDARPKKSASDLKPSSPGVKESQEDPEFGDR